jgi:hypothetical protein
VIVGRRGSRARSSRPLGQIRCSWAPSQRRFEIWALGASLPRRLRPPTGHVPRTHREWDRGPATQAEGRLRCLRRDELINVATPANYTGLDRLWLPRSVLASDFVVSTPKIKTHRLAGGTLSMRTMFGIVPGTQYGWPKNVLYWKGIHRSILAIYADPLRYRGWGDRRGRQRTAPWNSSAPR